MLQALVAEQREWEETYHYLPEQTCPFLYRYILIRQNNNPLFTFYF